MRNFRPWSRPFAWFATAFAGLMIALALINLVLNTARVESWAPLLILMLSPLGLGIWSLRNQDRRERRR